MCAVTTYIGATGYIGKEHGRIPVFFFQKREGKGDAISTMHGSSLIVIIGCITHGDWVQWKG
ncbi:hypothetical protein DRW41_07040 [Neobacillus piezotolerans]|uniref:Uncharacterized protein n=1 Tax=Neobacillus piezotolerans TaxID=2259171 RepID=A0A3D8GTQ2_9BACI|nr:hypothetical protein DRW41_07040 [Neobacillus piezotolerans]